jgi:hypothetical protein
MTMTAAHAATGRAVNPPNLTYCAKFPVSANFFVRPEAAFLPTPSSAGLNHTPSRRGHRPTAILDGGEHGVMLEGRVGTTL